MRVAIVRDVGCLSISMMELHHANPGDYVIVPDEWPDEVCVITTHQGSKALKSWEEDTETFQVFPERNAELAWKTFCEKVCEKDLHLCGADKAFFSCGGCDRCLMNGWCDDPFIRR